ncbi:alpha-ketoacid dehydrogenase subunit beta, partial [Bacillus sp. D-CC]
MAVMSYIDAITLAMREEMERDEKVFVLGEDVGKKGGVFKATHGLYDQFGEDRALDAPIATPAIADSASGVS